MNYQEKLIMDKINIKKTKKDESRKESLYFLLLVTLQRKYASKFDILQLKDMRNNLKVDENEDYFEVSTYLHANSSIVKIEKKKFNFYKIDDSTSTHNLNKDAAESVLKSLIEPLKFKETIDGNNAKLLNKFLVRSKIFILNALLLNRVLFVSFLGLLNTQLNEKLQPLIAILLILLLINLGLKTKLLGVLYLIFLTLNANNQVMENPNSGIETMVIGYVFCEIISKYRYVNLKSKMKLNVSLLIVIFMAMLGRNEFIPNFDAIILIFACLIGQVFVQPKSGKFKIIIGLSPLFLSIIYNLFFGIELANVGIILWFIILVLKFSLLIDSILRGSSSNFSRLVAPGVLIG